MSADKSGDSGGRYSDICGATTSGGDPCQLPAGWGTPGTGGGRCRYHGGCSTGPEDVGHLEGNTYAAGNAGGGAPEGNTNARIHGGFSDWRKAYERFDEDTRAWVDRIAADYREEAATHAADVPAKTRAELCLEMATVSILGRRASADVWAGVDGSGPGRGLVVEKTVERDGDTVTVEGLNPASRASHALNRREREIAERLRLWPGFR
jgi:hypothetical protein